MKVLIFVIFCFFGFYLLGQNISSTAADGIALQVDGQAPVFSSIYEVGKFLGYFGSFSGDSSDVDLGTSNENILGKLHLGIKGMSSLTIDADGRVGMGLTNPGSRLSVEGNILMTNSAKGVLLNDYLGPMISRRWDPFITGPNRGVGRWGLFLEDKSLVFGIPDLPGKAFEFSKYLTSSLRTPIVTINEFGEMKRPAQDSIDLLPFAMGLIKSDGNIIRGSGNFVVESSIGEYKVTFNGVPYDQTQFVVAATVQSDLSFPFPFIVTYQNDSDQLVIKVYSSGTGIVYSGEERNIHFVVYRL